MSQPTFVSASDVQAALNATYDQANQVYGIYGLNMTSSSFQAHVTFANNYVNNILGSSLAQTDPLYQTAWFVALDVACIRILARAMSAAPAPAAQVTPS